MDFSIKLHRKPFLIYLLFLLPLGISSCSGASKVAPEPVTVYSYKIVNTYPHDTNAFTQGLVFEDGVIYEGTGRYGKSSLRKVDLETGKIRDIHELPERYFGEGITVFEDIIIQLTWKSRLGLVYDKESFEVLRDFTYESEGWGITHDGERLIMSDGTSTLRFLDPEDFSTTGHIEVHKDDTPLNNLNELEYIDGQIYANVWPTDNIAIIDPQSGRVVGWMELFGLQQTLSWSGPMDVLNGIAYDAADNRLFVTGKLWPRLFEIELVAKE